MVRKQYSIQVEKVVKKNQFHLRFADYALVEAPSTGNRQEGTNAGRSGGLAEDCNTRWVTAKGGNVLLDPLHSHDLVAKGLVASDGGSAPGGSVLSPAEQAEAVVDGHDNDTTARNHVAWLENDDTR